MMLGALWMLSSPALALDEVLRAESYELDNGLKVTLLEDHRLPRVVVDTWFQVGSFDDPAGASGFAHLFEHLMFMGTERVPQGVFDQSMERGGGSNNATTGADITNYFDWGPSHLLKLLLTLEADRMTGLDITQEKLDLQREVVRNERRQNYEDAPYGRVWLELAEMLYPPTHPYHLEGIGSHEDLLAASLDHVQTFYRSWYAPNNASLVVAGDFEPEQVRQWIEELYGHIPALEVPEHRAVELPRTAHEPRRRIQDRVDLPALIMAWHAPPHFEEAEAELQLAASLLGEGEDALMIRRLVHEEELAQEISVYLYPQDRGSLFIVEAYLQPEASYAEAERALRDCVRELAEAALEEELAIARRGIEMDRLWELESLLSRAELIQDYLHHPEQGPSLSWDLERYRAVTLERLQAAVQEWLIQDPGVVLEVEPAAEEQVAE